jgi:hypothetical protein
MLIMDDRFDDAVDAVGRVAKTAMAPWGGVDACLDAYEAAIRATTDAQLSLARSITAGPMRSCVASCANMTRDIGAAQLSRVRWIVDA